MFGNHLVPHGIINLLLIRAKVDHHERNYATVRYYEEIHHDCMLKLRRYYHILKSNIGRLLRRYLNASAPSIFGVVS